MNLECPVCIHTLKLVSFRIDHIVEYSPDQKKVRVRWVDLPESKDSWLDKSLLRLAPDRNK